MLENPCYELDDVICACKSEFGVEDVSSLKGAGNPKRPILAVMASLARELSKASVVEIGETFGVTPVTLMLLIKQGRTIRKGLPSLYEKRTGKICRALEVTRTRVRPLREKIEAIIGELLAAIGELSEIQVLHVTGGNV